ncbi:MAG: aminopeptidase P family protein [Rhodobacteraceae bacterium]|nr:aminopeptidase P family protein [Paracoccaceae bacterium]MBR9819830.1 aminopeptidase P family protein [Paracoccaceae bacterium]
MSQSALPETEYRDRLARIQTGLAAAGAGALLLSTDADLRYVAGFLTRFWESPTRPWFLLVPARGDPVAVIPSIGQALMARTWVRDIRCWRAPDMSDDGVSLLLHTICDLLPAGGTLALPEGLGTTLRMPYADQRRLEAGLAAQGRRIGGDGRLLERLRSVKSPAEITLVRATCACAGRAFARVPEIAAEGVPLSQVFRDFQALCLAEGADWVPYLAGAAAPGGYGDVISPADDRPLARGDVLMLDTGLIRQGYFCDFDRNFSLGPPLPEVARAHERLIEATQAAFALARPGARVCDLFHAMDRIVTGGAGGSGAGRLGHGLGLQLTEQPSLIPEDETVLEPGMVLTLEPGIDLAPGRMLVHEENIVVQAGHTEWLTGPADAAILEL